MRLTDYLKSLDSLATAASLCSPILGMCQSVDVAAQVPGGDPLEEHERVVIVREGDRLVGYCKSIPLLNCSIDDHFAITATARKTARDVMEHIAVERVVEPTSTITAILNTIETVGCELLLVGSEEDVQGSIAISELLKPPALIFFLCLSLELEGAALELCSLYPRAFVALPPSRRAAAIDCFNSRKKNRIKAIADFSDEMETTPHEEVWMRELLQTTMMCDKKTMLITAELKLSESKSKIRRVFEFFERIRNYVAHPSARFAHDFDDAERLGTSDHEQVNDDATWTIPVTLAVAEELALTPIELAKAVRECHELIADIDRAQNVR